MADELDVDDNPYRAAFAQSVVVGETDADAERLYAKHVALLRTTRRSLSELADQ